jgi:sterol desaturase/sphingolipid hydroxylase (fatty acid hydroxylase superfamily)
MHRVPFLWRWAHQMHHSAERMDLAGMTYGSFPLWDILGGTWRNPVGFPAEYGFWDGASKRVGAMLLGRNVGDGERA